MASETPVRRPYTGSCHCGTTKYTVYLTLPPTIRPTRSGVPGSTTRIRKCNCTTCHKMGFFHVRLQDPVTDFCLLSPIASPTSVEDAGAKNAEVKHGGIVVGEGGLRDYTCLEGQIHWLFCGRCGVRCFAVMGEGEVVKEGDEGKGAWKPKGGFRQGGGGGYLSVNAATLEAGQKGLDLREWHEKGWISYLDCLYEREEDRLGRPCEGGMY